MCEVASLSYLVTLLFLFNQSLLLIFDVCCFFCIHYVYLGEDNEYEK